MKNFNVAVGQNQTEPNKTHLLSFVMVRAPPGSYSCSRTHTFVIVKAEAEAAGALALKITHCCSTKW